MIGVSKMNVEVGPHPLVPPQGDYLEIRGTTTSTIFVETIKGCNPRRNYSMDILSDPGQRDYLQAKNVLE